MKKSIPFILLLSLIVLAVSFSCSKSPTTPEPTATPTEYLSPTISPTSTHSPTQSVTPSITATPSVTPTFTASPTATATATRTSTPENPAISGDLKLPAGTNCSGDYWQVLVDTDMNFNNGIVNMAMGVCGSSADVPYSVTAPAGTYYVYALIKAAGVLTSPPIAGDYLGWLGAVYPASPASAAVVFTADTELYNQDITMALAQNNVGGTLTLPANAEGLPLLIALHPTTNPAVGVFYMSVENISGSTGTTLPYRALCYMPGTFYITVQISGDGSALPRAPKSGDYVGQLTPPAVMDPANDNQPLDITLTVFP